MKNLLKTLVIISLITLTIWLFFFYLSKEEDVVSLDKVASVEKLENISEEFIESESIMEIVKKTTIKLEVPFSVQAPFREWSDPRQQNACEEVAAIMAMYWVKGEKLSALETRQEIIAISDWEEKTYGFYQDSSAKDTMERIFKTYYNYQKVELVENIKISDIIFQLEMGNLVIVPANGQKLNNPFFTPPGPEYHMLVIIGYDYETAEFIVNESGTKHGQDYRYNENVLFSAIRDYPTGYHETIIGESKNMIVVFND